MASDEPQLDHNVVDLLYDDELDPQDRQAAEREVDASPTARRELVEFESMLGRIRQTDLEEDVPDSVHDSIMAAARKHAARSASRQARVTERAPSASKPRTAKTLWGRLGDSGVAQLVLAATVVLAAGFVFVQFTGSSPERKYNEANSAVSAKIDLGPPNQLAQADQPPSAKPAPAPVAEQANLDERDNEHPAPTGAKSTDTGDGVESKIGKLAQLEKTARADSPRHHRHSSDRRHVSHHRSAPGVARKARPRKKKSEAIHIYDDLRRSNRASQGSAAGAAARSNHHARPAPSKASSMAERSQKMAAAEPSQPSAAADKAPSGLSDSTDLGQAVAGNIGDESNSRPAPARAATAKADEAKPATARQQQRPEGQTSTVNRLESSYANGNYAGVVTQADRYLSRASGGADEARVLELKARALARQGKTRQADQTYAELQRKHPSYKSDQVRRERQRLAQTRHRKARERRAAPQKDVAAKPAKKKNAPAATSAPSSTSF